MGHCRALAVTPVKEAVMASPATLPWDIESTVCGAPASFVRQHSYGTSLTLIAARKRPCVNTAESSTRNVSFLHLI